MSILGLGKRKKIKISSESRTEGIKAEISAEEIGLILQDDQQVSIRHKKYYLQNGEYCILFKAALLEIAKLPT